MYRGDYVYCIHSFSIMNVYCPFVEKHRPKHFDDIVLDAYNKKILTNMISTGYFPHMLFYGPPGTGKTTTIINMINSYQEKSGKRDRGLVIHLNASDERGIDTIRNQICSFVSSNPLFNKGIKFVILDEVDYMTKNAQQALRYLLQEYQTNVRFCLICNYISKIDDGLQNEFLKLRFSQLPEDEVIRFLEKITHEEHISIDRTTLSGIQKTYKSDIRSMINFIQTNQDNAHVEMRIIGDHTWKDLYSLIACQTNDVCQVVTHIHGLSITYNMNVRNIIINFLNFVIRNHHAMNTKPFLYFVEGTMPFHYMEDKQIMYVVGKLRSFFVSSSPEPDV
jgi:DNA polymerase III gamma/tau subunit